MVGYRAVFIDLTKQKIIIKEIPRDLRIKFLGGRGLNAYYIYNLIHDGIDPFHPDNVLALGAGLLCGIPALGSSRMSIMTKSPLTNCLGDSNIGERFAVEMRRSGFDHVLIKGKAEKPVVICLDDGDVSIRKADGLWGLDTYEAHNSLLNEYGDDYEFLIIGQAGENLVRFASIRSRVKGTAGRTGIGAVAGSKNIKAIAVHGSRQIKWYDDKRLYRYCKELNDRISNTKWGRALSRYGTPIMMIRTYPMGLLRFRNFSTNYLEGFDSLHPENMDKYAYGSAGCYGCVIRCRRRYTLDKGRFPHKGEGPDYGFIGAFGFTMGCNNLETILRCVYLCNKYGLDIMETGSIIAWVTELHERGIVDEKMFGGLKPEWGSEDYMLGMIEQIVFRRGLGAILADGINYASERLGNNSKYYALHVKGQSWILSDDRAVPSFALGMAVATRGCDHLRSRPASDLYGLPEDFLKKLYGGYVSSDFRSYEGKSRMVRWHELQYAVVDSLGLCKFQTRFISVHAPSFDEWSKIVEYACDLKLSPTDLFEIGERIYTLERMFNIRNGFGREDDYPPERMFKEGTVATNVTVKPGTKLDYEKYDELLSEYYSLHGWGDEGVPTEKGLEKLGLSWERKIGWPE